MKHKIPHLKRHVKDEKRCGCWHKNLQELESARRLNLRLNVPDGLTGIPGSAAILVNRVIIAFVHCERFVRGKAAVLYVVFKQFVFLSPAFLEPCFEGLVVVEWH